MSLLAASCLSALGGVLIAPVLPQMRQAFAGVAGVDVIVPVVLTVPALFVGLAAPFAGLVVDLVDRKRLLLVALVVYAVAGTAPLYLAHLSTILLSRVLIGICEAAIMTCCTTLIGDYWSGTQRSRRFSLQSLVTALSATVFLALGGLLGTSGWRTPFWLYTIALVLVPLVTMVIWQPSGGRRAERRRLEPLPRRQLVAPCAITLVGGVVFYALIVELPFILTESGVSSSAAIGGLSALMAIATAAGSFAFARLSHQTARRLLPTSFGLAALGFGLVFATKAVPVITAGAVVAGFGNGMLLPVLLTWTVNRLEFQQRGRGTGLWIGAMSTGGFLCPLLITAIAAGAGGLRPAIGVLGILAVTMAAVSVLTTRDSVPLNLTTD
ncbi:MFS transporter [Kutzneria sp. CA-103260]|uniref:MFS transporter n=1 Tax=Kutzneria sp. CA-103260 TaxID=2802641 RepID=UPI0020119749|nr:MFS transporter [Kutzneria sp. CA-103260]